MSKLINWVNRPSFGESVANGISHCRAINLLGVNPDVDTGTETVWPGGGLYAFQSAAVALEALSGDAADTAAGTGARTILVIGLDANYAEISETVTLNGTTPVALTGTYLRVNSVTVVTAGSGGANAGAITVRVPGPGATLAFITIGDNKALNALYTVPVGYTLQIKGWSANPTKGVGGTDIADAKLMFRTQGSVFVPVDRIDHVVQANIAFKVFDPPIFVPGKADVKIDMTSSANNLDAVCSFWGILYKDE